MDMSDKMREQINKERSAGIAAIERQKAEIERLNGIIAMQADVITKARAIYSSAEPTYRPSWDDMNAIDDTLAASAITASSDTVSSYLNEVRAKALEDAALKMPSYANEVCFHRVYVQEAVDALYSMAAELRTNKES